MNLLHSFHNIKQMKIGQSTNIGCPFQYMLFPKGFIRQLLPFSGHIFRSTSITVPFHKLFKPAEANEIYCLSPENIAKNHQNSDRHKHNLPRCTNPLGPKFWKRPKNKSVKQKHRQSVLTDMGNQKNPLDKERLDYNEQKNNPNQGNQHSNAPQFQRMSYIIVRIRAVQQSTRKLDFLHIPN